MFDPSVGVWLQQDPIKFDAGDVNLHRYVTNNPLNHSDPSGLQGKGIVPVQVQGRETGQTFAIRDGKPGYQALWDVVTKVDPNTLKLDQKTYQWALLTSVEYWQIARTDPSHPWQVKRHIEYRGDFFTFKHRFDTSAIRFPSEENPNVQWEIFVAHSVKAIGFLDGNDAQDLKSNVALSAGQYNELMGKLKYAVKGRTIMYLYINQDNLKEASVPIILPYIGIGRLQPSAFIKADGLMKELLDAFNVDRRKLNPKLKDVSLDNLISQVNGGLLYAPGHFPPEMNTSFLYSPIPKK